MKDRKIDNDIFDTGKIDFSALSWSDWLWLIVMGVTIAAVFAVL
jgi:hypothetical protein